jgi:hypothetical protein
MRVVSSAASRTVAVTKGAVRTTRHRAPRVSNRRSTARTVLVARVRPARSQTGVRKIKLTRVLGRYRGTADLNCAVKNRRRRTSYKVRVGSVVRMTSCTVDRQSERVSSRVVRTMAACRRRFTVTERTVTCRSRIPVGQRAGIRWIVTVSRRTSVVRRTGTVNKTDARACVISTVVNLGVKTRRVHITVTLRKDPQRVRARIIRVVMIKRTRSCRLNPRVTVRALKISGYMSIVSTRARGIIVTSRTTKTISVAPAAVTGRRGVTSTTTSTVTRGVTNSGHKDRLAARRIAVV